MNVDAEELLRQYCSEKRRNFANIQLFNVNLSHQDLSDIDLRGANIQGTDFTGTLLKGANFCEVQASDTCFQNAVIQGANFANANLQRANFSEAKAGIRPAVKIALIILLVLLAAISGVAHGHAVGITFSDTPLVSSLNNEEYQRYLLIPRTVMLSALMIYATVAIWNGISKSLAAVALTVTGIFLTATIVALGFFRDSLWSVVDYSLWGVAGSMAWAAFGSVTLAINGTMLGVLTSASWIPLVSLIASLGTVGLTAIEPDFLTSWHHPEAWIVACFFDGLGGYLAWKACQGQPNFVWMRRLAVFLITLFDKTDFSEADLSDANFTSATLGKVKFGPKVCLRRTCFANVTGLDHARLNGTYLDNSAVKQLVVEKRVRQNGFCNFNGLNLQGINLQGARLAESSFVGADLSEADLQNADLSRANLTRTQLDNSNLTGAILTGAVIEDWSITHRTELHDVVCQYVFMKWVKPGDTDQNPLRKPDSYTETFEEGQFVDFIQPLFTTLDLYHTQDIDPRAIAISYKHLEETHPEAQLDIVAIEKRGRDKEQILLKVEAARDANLSELSDAYLKTYRQLKQLPKDSLLLLVAEQNFHINLLTQRIESMLGQLNEMAESSAAISKRLGNLVVFTLTHGDFSQGFSMSVLIWPHQSTLPEITTSHLPPAPEVSSAYQDWSQLYKAIYSTSSRISFSSDAHALNNISLSELDDRAAQLVKTFNTWLRSDTFLTICDHLRERFAASDEIRIVVQTTSPEVCCLPWQSWNFMDTYPKVEFAFGRSFASVPSRNALPRQQRRILAVFGSSRGIDISADQKLLEQLSDSAMEVVFLHEPSRQDFHDMLRDPKGWDILYFAGHSETEQDSGNEALLGTIQLNGFDHLQFAELRFALSRAIEQGLQLAIFNSCDGIGLAQQLESLQIPLVVVMKEPVPDQVAQLFLKNFLKAFAVGEPLQVALREARQQLESIQDRFPYASWLPILFQNSAEEPGVW
ncbi:pentapeptide repeat-containing protein [Oscillatoria sp. CS-180]|uniref:pentapeptide repeat-containing protein n=1 Tax=Oscillatoria sp. CS-180 TaxID=3021720 RepID=UPI00233145C6|nr:pentapeptide repeat-containing protein [Oscillatoria sp. CS-180]MDB9526528.1 pentapeptide repeat-containing protein [Oscillatoria sp. CS-180]